MSALSLFQFYGSNTHFKDDICQLQMTHFDSGTKIEIWWYVVEDDVLNDKIRKTIFVLTVRYTK